MVGRIDDDGVVAHAQPVELDEDAADGMVDQRDHAVIVRRHLAQLRLRLGPARARAWRGKSLRLGSASAGSRSSEARCHQGAAVEVLPALDRQFHLVRMVQQAPGLRAVEGMVRVRERDQAQQGVSAFRFCSHSIVRSAHQALLCTAAGMPELQVCAAPVPGCVSPPRGRICRDSRTPRTPSARNAARSAV